MIAGEAVWSMIVHKIVNKSFFHFLLLCNCVKEVKAAQLLFIEIKKKLA